MEDFEEDLAAIYRMLLENQEPLGHEFEQVWAEHLEELYEE